MCGIVGVSNFDRAAETAYLGLYALQHRGQEATGIAAVDGGRATLHKAHGLVMDGFDEESLAQLDGRVAIGHTRYSTAGGKGLENAQPIVVRYHQGDLVLVHNGNLTNAQSIREELVQEGALFQSSVDSEVIVHLIARSRMTTPDEQIHDALSRLVGAFSVIISNGDAMYGARDPWGFRPLVLGKKGDGYVFASETCALDLIGAELIEEVEPGQIVKVEDGRISTLPSLAPAGEVAPCIFELIYFARPDSKVWGVAVDRARRAFGRQLAEELGIDADCVFSVPDSSNSAALGCCEAS